MVKFDNLFDFKKKSTIKAGNGLSLDEGKYPFYTSSNVLTKSINEYLFENESLIFGTGGQASVHFCDEKFAVSTDCFVCQPKDEQKVFSKFVYYFLSGNIYLLEDGFKGAGLKHISKSYIQNLEIPLPSLSIQKQIAARLDKAQEIIRYNQDILKKYDQLAQSLFLDMFGDPVKNEKGWEKKELKNFGKISTGNTPSRKDMKNYNSKYIEWVKTDNIVENQKFISQAVEYLSELGAKKGRLVKENSLLVACIAGSLQSIGRAAITNREVAFNQQINSIEPHNNINISFLYYLFKSSRKYIQDHATNGMKRILSKSEFEKIKFILPPITLQNEFAERVQAIEAQKELAQEALAKSEELFQSLLQQSFASTPLSDR